MAHTQRDWYDTPKYYDYIFDDNTQHEADFILKLYQHHASSAQKSPLVLEPACGSGRLVEALAQRGCRVHGFDLNLHMLDYANKRTKRSNRSVKLWQARMERFDLPEPAESYEFAHCLVSTFKYLLTEADALANLNHVAEALRDGGLYLLGIHLTDYSRTSCEHERWVVTKNDAHVVCNTRNWPANSKTRLEDVRNRLRITESGKTHLQETRWQFRTYNAAQVKSLLKKVPQLELVACYDFQYDLLQPRKLDDSYSDIILVLKKNR